MAGSSIRHSKCHKGSSSGSPQETVDAVEVVHLPSSDDVEVPPVAQPDTDSDGSDDGLDADDVVLYPSLKIRVSPKHLVVPTKRFNACQKKAVVELGLGELLNLQIHDIPKRMARWFVRCS
ncbi:PREDICTED: uncharacterized protein LOC109168150 [Ipomoea nil]|uniref:uncharacterized protein LOC109168150 n=1 Tax=Ipomoea nil TaxID=35883 RepID=UPI000901C41D|nr:PREDICTED: uncharacterized protein LOC109168150 [Ipomoea nil]